MTAASAVGTWREHAVCTRVDPEVFYPGRGAGQQTRVAAALAICDLCPVQGPCLADALDMDRHLQMVGMVRGGRWFPTPTKAAKRRAMGDL